MVLRRRDGSKKEPDQLDDKESSRRAARRAARERIAAAGRNGDGASEADVDSSVLKRPDDVSQSSGSFTSSSSGVNSWSREQGPPQRDEDQFIMLQPSVSQAPLLKALAKRPIMPPLEIPPVPEPILEDAPKMPKRVPEAIEEEGDDEDELDERDQRIGSSTKEREMPMPGSATQLRRLRGKTRQELVSMLDMVDANALAVDVKAKQRVFYTFGIAVTGGVIVCILAVVLHLDLLANLTAISLLVAPVWIVLRAGTICAYLARTQPKLAQEILSVLTLGNTGAIRTLAAIYVECGDYAKAEKVISDAVNALTMPTAKDEDMTDTLREYIVMCALLANLRAHIGRMSDADQLIRTVLAEAETHHKKRNDEGSACLLAETLNHAAQLCDQLDKTGDAAALARRAVSLACAYQKPPLETAIFSLSNAGYYCNVIGEYHEALVYLMKANELATKTGAARDGQVAFIQSNLAIANLGVGRATVCKRYLVDAEVRTMAPLGMSERPHTFQCWAIYHFANGHMEEALKAYEKSIEYCAMQKPNESVLLLRIVKEYTVLLKELGKQKEAKQNELKVTQIQFTLDTISAKLVGKREKKVKAAAKKAQKLQLPLFWMALTAVGTYLVWDGGLRIAPVFPHWLLFLFASSMLAIKMASSIRANKKSRSMVSSIPGIGYIVGELDLLANPGTIVILIAAVGIYVFVATTKPAPNTVPETGLLGVEYSKLSEQLYKAGSVELAQRASDLAAAAGSGEARPNPRERSVDENKSLDADDDESDSIKSTVKHVKVKPKAASKSPSSKKTKSKN